MIYFWTYYLIKIVNVHYKKAEVMGYKEKLPLLIGRAWNFKICLNGFCSGTSLAFTETKSLCLALIVLSTPLREPHHQCCSGTKMSAGLQFARSATRMWTSQAGTVIMWSYLHPLTQHSNSTLTVPNIIFETMSFLKSLGM